MTRDTIIERFVFANMLLIAVSQTLKLDGWRGRHSEIAMFFLAQQNAIKYDAQHDYSRLVFFKHVVYRCFSNFEIGWLEG